MKAKENCKRVYESVQSPSDDGLAQGIKYLSSRPVTIKVASQASNKGHTHVQLYLLDTKQPQISSLDVQHASKPLRLSAREVTQC